MNITVNRSADRPSWGWPPLWFWILPVAVALLRSLPYLWVQFASPPAGRVYLKLGYLPKDFLSYLAFIRQVGDTGAAVFVNPFTTEPQSPRFLLLFHWLLGAVTAMVGHANVVLELSRGPLAFAFFWLLWRFLGPILVDARERLWACVLVAFSGGLECYLQPFLTFIPASAADAFRQDTWELYGWNTFASCFNPLWIAAFCGALLTLEPMLQPEGPKRTRDFVQIGAGFFGTYLIHPYTAIFIAVLALTGPLVEWLFCASFSLKKHLLVIGAMVVPSVIIVSLCLWQAQDPVYRRSASGILGPQGVSVFWYPITLGVLGLAATRGLKTWFDEARPYRYAIVSWIAAVVLLHTSPLINGYKFLFLLHLPLCVLAAPVMNKVAPILLQGGTLSRAVGGLAAIALFGQAVVLPVLSTKAALAADLVPAEYAAITMALSQLPAGNVLAPPDLGNIIPAYTSHRVWVGQWFLTPDFADRANFYIAVAQGTGASDALPKLVLDQHIRYLVLPLAKAQSLDAPLRPMVREARAFGKLALVTLDPVR